MRVFGYCRVSTTVQIDGYSLDEQRGRIEAYCVAMGWQLVRVFVDGGESGAKLDRPALKEMCSLVKSVDKVVVYKLDRLSRSQKDTLYLIEDVFLKNNTDFVSITENFDTSTPFGKAMVGILAVFAQLEREQIKERMLMGRAARAKEGKYCGQFRTAIGYDYIDGKLVVNENERPQIVKAFDLFIRGYSHSRIAKILNDEGSRHKYGEWQHSAISAILTNPIYIGKVSFGGELFDGLHEPIIDEATFYTAKKREERRRRKRENPCRSNASLSGILFCARCGRKYYKRSDPKTYPAYACNGRMHNYFEEKCMNKIWPLKDLEEVVFSQVRQLKLSIPTEEKPDNTGEIMAIEDQISRLLDLYALGTMPVETLNDKIAVLNARRANLFKQKEEAPKDYDSLVRTFCDIVDKASTIEIHAVLVELIDRIEIDGENVSIFWRF